MAEEKSVGERLNALEGYRSYEQERTDRMAGRVGALEVRALTDDERRTLAQVDEGVKALWQKTAALEARDGQRDAAAIVNAKEHYRAGLADGRREAARARAAHSREMIAQDILRRVVDAATNDNLEMSKLREEARGFLGLPPPAADVEARLGAAVALLSAFDGGDMTFGEWNKRRKAFLDGEEDGDG